MFNSLLFKNKDEPKTIIVQNDPILQDLNLDELFQQVDEFSGYSTKNFDYQLPQNLDDVNYRQAIFDDLIDPDIYQALVNFTDKMIDCLNQKSQLERLDPLAYRQHVLVSLWDQQLKAINELVEELADQSITSEGLRSFLQYLNDFQKSSEVEQLREVIADINQKFSKIYYRLYLSGRNVTVESDPQPRESFDERFKKLFGGLFEDTDKMLAPIKIKHTPAPFNMNNLQTSIISQLIKLYPDQFAQLNEFYGKYRSFHNDRIQRAVQELTFYVGWAKVEKMISQEFGLDFTLPKVTVDGEQSISDSFDFSMAVKNLSDKDSDSIVTNDYHLLPDRPFLIISGPNQGGKTTYARMVGQAYYLLRLGMPIPGSQAILQLKNKIFTHFDRQESSNKLSGLLEIDVQRIHDIIDQVDDHSFVVLNELFSSTSEEDATELGKRVLTALMKKNVCGIYVTFFEALGDHPGVQTLMSQVDDQAQRTFKIVPADLNGKAYTSILLANYHLTTDDIEGRFQK